MAFTYDVSTDRGKVRLLIGDTDESNVNAQVFQDADVDALLTLENADVRLAAAQALDSMAASEAMVQKVIRVMDLSTNGAATARVLMERAALLRRQVADGSGDFAGLFDWAEQVNDPFGARERIWRQALRGSA